MSWKLDAFIEGYIDCLLWVDDENLLDDFTIHQASESVMKEIKDACVSFFNQNKEVMEDLIENGGNEVTWAHMGHDFKLTRDGHGVGFWDRGYGESGALLTKASKAFGSCDALIGYWKEDEG